MTNPGAWSRWWHRRTATPAPDPFASLLVQQRLGVVADQLREIDTDARMFARGRRRIAALAAYDALLADACHLAGVEVPDGPCDEGERLREELELASRGWSW